MSDIAVRVDGLAKVYRLGAKRERYRTLRGALTDAVMSPLRAIRSGNRGRKGGELWALNDVAFQLRCGEVTGIVGRNGAGKTTLLKILSRITEPTRGYAEIHGRIASLLEVGTGFHQELTGRENIYLNGSILGMRKSEINRKFDEIVAFAEVEKFIDTPVKHYSSGMYVRLGFSVAAHMEPEILVVDEVLAVGDAAFQKKCLGKMGNVAGEGRTVLFVSHNLSQIKNLCKKGILLEGGRCVQYGPIDEVVGSYHKSLLPLSNSASSAEALHGEQKGLISWSLAGTGSADKPHMLLTEKGFTVEFVFRLKQPVYKSNCFISLQSATGQKIAGWGEFGRTLNKGTHKMSCYFPYMPVRPGIYYWQLEIRDGRRAIERMVLHPEFVVATQDYSRLSEEFGGILNVPCEVDFKMLGEGSGAGAPV
jgi:ABC-type polysaccharide/polyol phosphate transport system ATPase subunit